MHDVLQERILRKLEVLPEQQLYQVLDYIEFLEAKYAADLARTPDSLQRFAERLEDGMRVRSVAPKVISGTVGIIGSARKVMKTVTETAKSVSDTATDILTPTPPKPGPTGSDSDPAR
ncbi:MAG: hypothetical protein ABIS27_14365 [Longimicrobiales bacterium]